MCRPITAASRQLGDFGSLQMTLRLFVQWPGRGDARRADAAQAGGQARKQNYTHHLHVLRQTLAMQHLHHENIGKVALNGIVECLAK